MGLKSTLVKYVLKKIAPSLGRYVFTRFGLRFASRGAGHAGYSRYAHPPYAYFKASKYGKYRKHGKSRGLLGMVKRVLKKFT